MYQNIKDVKVKIGLEMKSFIHSDQGMHYTIKNYKDLCNELNLTISMSRRWVSPDNGACKSIFASLKTEAIYIKNRKKWKKDELKKVVKEYIFFYNHQRPQTRLNGLSPIEYRMINS